MTLSEIRYLLPYPNLTIRQVAVLILIYESETKIPFRLVARRLGIPKASITRAYDGLGTLKLLQRERDEDDRRNVFGILTDEGKQLVEKILK